MKKYTVILMILLTPLANADWVNMGQGFGHMDLGGITMFLGMGLFWILPIALVLWGITFFNRNRDISTKEDNAIEIIKRRYAKGELSSSEMETMLEKLKSL